jgi:hypothetical protein
MITLTPSLLIASAQSFVGMQPDESCPLSTVRGLLTEVGLPETAPWSAAFVHHVGFHSHYDEDAEASNWPLPRTGSCSVLARFAESRGLLHGDPPRRGEIMLLWEPRHQRFMQAGIVTKLVETRSLNGAWVYECSTIEGNVSLGGGGLGPYVRFNRRMLCPKMGDRFVRWVDLDGFKDWARSDVHRAA